MAAAAARSGGIAFFDAKAVGVLEEAVALGILPPFSPDRLEKPLDMRDLPATVAEVGHATGFCSFMC